MKWDCDYKIDQTVKEARRNINDYIDMLYVQALSKVYPDKKNDICKKIDKKSMDEFLKKRGYSLNYVLGKSVMVKGFTCVYVKDGYVEVWIDKAKNDKSVFINESLLTGLPITLNYIERI